MGEHLIHWVIAHTPGGIFVWPLGEEVDNRLVYAARVLTGFPADSAWIDASDWDLLVSPGTPHPNLLDRATVGDVEELRKVAAADVDAHEQALNAWVREQDAQAVKRVLVDMEPTKRAQLLAEFAEVSNASLA